MRQGSVIDRLRSADPAGALQVVDTPHLRRARVEAIVRSTDPDPLAPVPRAARSRYRRGIGMAAAALAIPCAALAANAVFGAHDVERGLPAGAKLLVGTNPKCKEVERDAVYDCKLAAAPRPDAPTAVQPDWRGAVSLMADRGDRINGGCRSQNGDGTAWRCYIGRVAADQHVLAPDLLGTRIHDRCQPSSSLESPPDRAPSAAPGSAIILCGSRDIIGFAATPAVPLHARRGH